jgi:hypothetical protein
LAFQIAFLVLAIVWPLIRLRGQPLASLTRLNPTVINIFEFPIIATSDGGLFDDVVLLHDSQIFGYHLL